ncbi:MAG: hypothetical protein UY41_C0041G0003 [Candidatus Moranbacteria bacterium GW2011_GWE1_49_15]|nr:MAG: hypothetical protein UY41_C0041G0003 [Candidatus Moranbacteria bacterium GW2011_GWE1_49_15]
MAGLTGAGCPDTITYPDKEAGIFSKLYNQADLFCKPKGG